MLLGELPGNSNVARIIIDDLLTIQKKKVSIMMYELLMVFLLILFYLFYEQLSIGEVAIVLVILSIGKENNGTEILSKWFDEGLYPQKEFIEIITMRSRMKVRFSIR